MIFSEFFDNELRVKETTPHFKKHYDLVVAGLGTAGEIAAIVAAKNGLSVLGIEQNSFSGGSATAGNIIGYYFGGRGGEYEALEKSAKEFEAESFVNIKGKDCVSNYAKVEYSLNIYKKEGIDTAFGTAVIGVFLEGKEVKGVRCANANEIFDISADFVIDATGNGSVVLNAGAKMLGGREIDNRFQPYSNVQKMRKQDFYSMFNVDSGYLNQYDAEEYGKAVLNSLTAKHWLAEKDYQSLGSSVLLGIREGKRIVGEKTLGFSQSIFNIDTEHTVFYAYSNIDNHGKDTCFEERDSKDWGTVCSLWGYLLRIPVPMEVFIPKDLRGLLAAGRILSVEHNLAAALRMRSDMARSGEVVAQMVTLALQNNCDIRNIPYKKLKEKLLQSGCLKKSDQPQMVDDKRNPEAITLPPIEKGEFFLKDSEEIKRQLSTDRPGHAMMSAAVGDFSKELKEWLNEENLALRRNSALALGLKKDFSCEDELLCLAGSLDGFIPKTSRKYNPLHAVSAISVLGKMGSQKAIPLLFSIIENEDYAKDIPFSADEFMQIKEEIYSQLFTHSFASLLEIGEQNKSHQKEIREKLERRINKDDFYMPITLKSGENYIHNLAPKIKEVLRIKTENWQ